MNGDREYSNAQELKIADNQRNAPEMEMDLSEEKGHAMLICSECFRFNKKSLWAVERLREIRTKHFENHAKSEEHLLALSIELNSAAAAVPYHSLVKLVEA